MTVYYDCFQISTHNGRPDFTRACYRDQQVLQTHLIASSDRLESFLTILCVADIVSDRKAALVFLVNIILGNNCLVIVV